MPAWRSPEGWKTSCRVDTHVQFGFACCAFKRSLTTFVREMVLPPLRRFFGQSSTFGPSVHPLRNLSQFSQYTQKIERHYISQITRYDSEISSNVSDQYSAWRHRTPSGVGNSAFWMTFGLGSALTSNSVKLIPSQ